MGQTKIDKQLMKAILKRDSHLKDIEDDINRLSEDKDKIQELIIITRYIDDDGEMRIGTRYIGGQYVCLGLLKSMERRLVNDLDEIEYFPPDEYTDVIND